MNQLDFIGDLPPLKPFKDIRNQRPSAAEEKAALCLELGRLCHKVPPSISQGSIEKTRDWVAAQQRALKVVNSKRSSIAAITAELVNMRKYLA
jgi:hypothetical protein